jgi:hypothetical protein
MTQLNAGSYETRWTDPPSPCCGANITFMDDGNGEWVLCCKSCYEEVALSTHKGSVYFQTAAYVWTSAEGE